MRNSLMLNISRKKKASEVSYSEISNIIAGILLVTLKQRLPSIQTQLPVYVRGVAFKYQFTINYVCPVEEIFQYKQ